MLESDRKKHIPKLKKTSLAEAYPEVARLWHLDKNGVLKPTDVVCNSGQRAWWKCLLGDDHEWEARIAQVVISFKQQSKSKGCPICRGLKVVSSNSLANINPKLANEWHPTRNGVLTPLRVHAGSHKIVWWLCQVANDHEWPASIKQRASGNGCPMCRGSKIVLSNSLAGVNPDLARDWHPTKNGELTPVNIHAGSHKSVWWQCSRIPDHEWYSSIDNRRNGSGCPYCNSGWTIENIRLFVESLFPYLHTFDPAELYVLFQQQEGLLETTGKGKAFIQALKTGKFSPEELEKFVKCQPSLVDEFINGQNISVEFLNDPLPDDLSENELTVNTEELPIVETADTLASFDSKIISSANSETIDFFIKSAIAKIWKHSFLNEAKAQEQLMLYQGDNKYAKQVRQMFSSEYEGAKALKIPSGYKFPYPPNLMQRYSAYLIKTRKRVGNWSGTGAGKTLSAILASRVVNAHLTVILCPNNVINNWQDKIKITYPDSLIYTKEYITQLKNIDHEHQYLLLNYEFFQQPNSEEQLKTLLTNCKVDFIVIDEIHFSKQRNPDKASKRKQLIAAFLSEAERNNENLHVLGMSATPVINELFEGKTLIELVTGMHHDDLDTKPTISNCIALYKKFVSYGIRDIPQYRQQLNEIVKEVDCYSFLAEIKKPQSHVALEAILTKAKLPFILEQLRSRTIIYTHYLDGIENVLYETITKNGWRVGFFTGGTKNGLDDFKSGKIDILIASSCIGTGVDGLQTVCNRLIINCLPWTHAEYKQLIGRLYRQGQKKSHVDVIIPLTFAMINGERWSWCESRWKRIEFKKSIADAAVDGVIPEGYLRSLAQAYKDTMKWLEQLNHDEDNKIERQKIELSLSSEQQLPGLRRIGDLSQMNHQINRVSSKETHQRFINNPSAWHEYHEAYQEARKEWPVIPYKEAIKWCQARPHMVIGDFGCGEAFLAQELPNKVYSFDYVAINDKVIACDMAHVPLQDAALDVVVFSLSLMGTNWIDYLREAHRCLKLDGRLWIAEPTARISDMHAFKELLERLGFDVLPIHEMGKFTFIKAIKSERVINLMAFEILAKKDSILN